MAEQPLIARLKAAEEGSRELDAAIAIAIKYELPAPMGECGAYLKLPTKEETAPPGSTFGCQPGTYWLVQLSGMSLRTAPDFTTSIDDAVRWVVPEGWDINIGSGSTGWWAELWERGNYYDNEAGQWADETLIHVVQHKATPALASCIVGLEARESK